MIPADSRRLRSISPFTGETVGTWRCQTGKEVLETANASEAAFHQWSRSSSADRAAKLTALARLLEESRDSLARLMALEMGKPVGQGVAEADKCALVCRYYARHAGAFLADMPVLTEARRCYVRHEPMGVVYGVMPWNFPFWQFFRFAAPAVAAGNGILLKHSPGVTGCALKIASLFSSAGFPPGLPGVLLVPGHRAGPVSRMIIRHPGVKAITLTGGVEAGRSIAREAGNELKKCVLELGGSDPAVVLEDADLELAAKTIAFSRLINAGQNCIASKRVIVLQKVLQVFLELFTREMERAVMGDPMEHSTTLGPMARSDLRETLHRQVSDSLAMGARLNTGGVIPDGPGFFYPPTVLSGVTPGMPAADQETFGPVAAVLSAVDDADAVKLAGRTGFGLGASVFTGDRARGESIAKKIASGACFINTLVRSDPRLPFGGTGLSGYGRELSSHGLMEFINVKTIWVE